MATELALAAGRVLKYYISESLFCILSNEGERIKTLLVVLGNMWSCNDNNKGAPSEILFEQVLEGAASWRQVLKRSSDIVCFV